MKQLFEIIKAWKGYITAVVAVISTTYAVYTYITNVAIDNYKETQNTRTLERKVDKLITSDSLRNTGMMVWGAKLNNIERTVNRTDSINKVFKRDITNEVRINNKYMQEHLKQQGFLEEVIKLQQELLDENKKKDGTTQLIPRY